MLYLAGKNSTSESVLSNGSGSFSQTFYSDIHSLEEEMETIRAEQEAQDQRIQSQKVALDSIVGDMGLLRFAGKDKDAGESPNPSRVGTPALEALRTENSPPIPTSTTPVPTLAPNGVSLDDIEMGEVEEVTKKVKSKKVREDREEGEATDGSSELSDYPDDI